MLGERIEMYTKIILKNPKILMIIQNFDNLSDAEYGMIGTQLMKFVENNYLNDSDIDEELYRKFATEQSSYYLDKTIGAALKYEIEHQNS